MPEYITEMKSTKTLAIELIEAAAKTEQALAVYRNARQTADKTPTGRIAKRSQALIDAADVEYKKAKMEQGDLEEAFRRARWDDKVAAGKLVRHKTLETIRNLFPDAPDVTRLWEAANDHFNKSRNRNPIPDSENGYKNGAIVVLDITPDSPAFKDVVTYRGWTQERKEVSDMRCHLWLYIGETGKVTRAKLYSGKVAERNDEKPSSGYLTDSFGTDLERGELSVSVSTCNGTTSEIRAWGATLMLVSDCIEKLQPVYEERMLIDALTEAKNFLS